MKTRFFKAIILFFATCFGVFLSVTTVFAEADKQSLISERANIASAINDQLGNVYTNDSYQAFSDGLAIIGGLPAIDAMISNIDATQEDVDAMTVNCQEILGYLTTVTTYDHISLLYLQEKTLRDVSSYTLRSIAIYNDELDRIQTLKDDPTSGEITVASLEVDIQNSSSLLVLLGDKTELEVSYSLAQSILLDSSFYVPSTVTLFEDAYGTIDSDLMSSIGFSLSDVLNNNDASIVEVSQTLLALNSALDLLVERPDLSALTLVFDTALCVDLSQYTESSSLLFSNGLEFVLDVLNDPETLEEDVSQALLDVNSLYALLVPLGDNSSLISQIDLILNDNYNLYTPNSVTIYLNKVQSILEQAQDLDRTEQDIVDLTQQLVDSASLLVERADKSNLILANNQAVIAYYEDKSSYTDSSYLLFKDAVAQYGNYLSVNEVIHDDNALQADVDQLTQLIHEALSYLEVIVDNSALIDIYVSKLAVSSNQYTPASLEAFYEEMDRIYLIIVSRELSQEVADTVLADLNSAQTLLIPRADFTELLSLYLEYSGVAAEKYTNTSYLNFTDYMMLASSTIMDSNSTQEIIDLCYEKLVIAHNSLQYKPGLIDIKANIENFDIKDLITLGESSIVSYQSSDDSILSVDDNGIVVGKSFGTANVIVTLENGRSETLSFLVKANITTTTLVFAILLPTVSIGVGFGFLFLKPHSFSFIKNIVTKKR